jgi:hypothetical protein
MTKMCRIELVSHGHPFYGETTFIGPPTCLHRAFRFCASKDAQNELGWLLRKGTTEIDLDIFGGDFTVQISEDNYLIARILPDEEAHDHH